MTAMPRSQTPLTATTDTAISLTIQGAMICTQLWRELKFLNHSRLNCIKDKIEAFWLLNANCTVGPICQTYKVIFYNNTCFACSYLQLLLAWNYYVSIHYPLLQEYPTNWVESSINALYFELLQWKGSKLIFLNDLRGQWPRTFHSTNSFFQVSSRELQQTSLLQSPRDHNISNVLKRPAIWVHMV